jgi:glycosyltransferase involved in cell wall biosynthesis
MKISFVIPTFNENSSLGELFEAICVQMETITNDFEIVFVDDGSSDTSFEIMQQLARNDQRIKIIKLRRNFGKSIALNEGFRLAEGDVIFTMDADLQDDPKEIPRFLAKLEEGYDLISGWKKKRKDPVLSKNLPSKLFNFMINLFSGLKLHDHNCGFKAYRKPVIKELSLYGDLHRYIPAVAHSAGWKVSEISVAHHERTFGKSKYGFERFSHGLFDFITVVFITRYLKRPMHFFGLFGLSFSLVGFGILSYLSFLWFMGDSIGERPLLMLGVLLLLIGGQIISTGLIAEMITYNKQKNSRDDVIDLIINNNS